MTSRSLIDYALAGVLVEVGQLPAEDDYARHLRSVEAALGRFCAALDDPKLDYSRDRLARESFMALLTLAQLLSTAYSTDPRTASSLAHSRAAVSALLDVLEPYVTPSDCETRRVLLDGEPLDTALARMFNATFDA